MISKGLICNIEAGLRNEGRSVVKNKITEKGDPIGVGICLLGGGVIPFEHQDDCYET